MSTERKSLVESVAGWFAYLGACARGALSSPKPDSQPAVTNDPHFEDWLRNDVKIVAEPNHRYSGELSGFLADSDLEAEQRSSDD